MRLPSGKKKQKKKQQKNKEIFIKTISFNISKNNYVHAIFHNL